MKILPVWLAIFFLSSYLVTTIPGPTFSNLDVLPKAPRKNEPVMAFYRLKNPTEEDLRIVYSFYINEDLMKTGATVLPALASKSYQYVYKNPLPLGEQVSFTLETLVNGRKHVSRSSIPPYPPQIMSSFVSFASFSSSVMESMASTTYYHGVFLQERGGWDPGLVISVILIALLIYLELTDPVHVSTNGFIQKLRVSYKNLTWVLFIIFIGLVYTRIAFILMG